MRVVALIDGEHYPPVVADAILELKAEYEVLGAAFLGGTEKIGSLPEDAWGVPVVRAGTGLDAMIEAIDRFKPDAVIDMSDEPVVDYIDRLMLANHALALGVQYQGADFTFTVPSLEDVASKPTVRIIGTGKRIGKTALSAFFARELKARGTDPIVLAMGRGGPPEPEILRGDEIKLDATALLALADSGKHAASDYIEDALMSRVTTVGCRRCGGGFAGAPLTSNVVEGTRVANDLPGELIVLEGSGSSLPPVQSDASIISTSATQPSYNVSGYFGPYRILTSDLAVITNCDSDSVTEEDLVSLEGMFRAINPDIKVIRTAFRPVPVGSIEGKRAFVATTAPAEALERISDHLESAESCTVVHVSNNLSKRPKLREELEAMAGSYDLLLTELKAAAVDVVTREGRDRGVPVVYFDNVPVTVGGDGDLVEEMMAVADLAVSRFHSK